VSESLAIIGKAYELWTGEKSSYSGANGGACVEVAPARQDMGGWRKSSHSGANGGDCVEVASANRVMVRDTTDRDGLTLEFPVGAWAEFVARVRS
jgi:Domain of unknown function (DUF397)